jgi:hypothetical protein
MAIAVISTGTCSAENTHDMWHVRIAGAIERSAATAALRARPLDEVLVDVGRQVVEVVLAGAHVAHMEV